MDDRLKAGMIAFGKARLNFPEGALFNWLKMILSELGRQNGRDLRWDEFLDDSLGEG